MSNIKRKSKPPRSLKKFGRAARESENFRKENEDVFTALEVMRVSHIARRQFALRLMEEDSYHRLPEHR